MAMDRERPRGRKRRKVCTFCVDKVEHIDYKDPAPPYHRHLRHASASADRGHQAGSSDRSAALRDRLIPSHQRRAPNGARLFFTAQKARERCSRAFCLFYSSGATLPAMAAACSAVRGAEQEKA